MASSMNGFVEEVLDGYGEGDEEDEDCAEGDGDAGEI